MKKIQYIVLTLTTLILVLSTTFLTEAKIKARVIVDDTIVNPSHRIDTISQSPTNTLAEEKLTTITLPKPAISKLNFSTKIQNSHLSDYSKEKENECKANLTDVLNYLPEELISSLNKVTLDFDPSENRGNANSNFMKLRCTNIEKSEFQAVAVHELGHIVDGGYLVGSSTQTSSFSDLGTLVKVDDPSLDYYSISWENDSNWKNSVTSDDFCSRYGSTDPYEDFAECFTYFVLHNNSFKEKAKTSTLLNEKYKFFEKEVFANFNLNIANSKANKASVYDITKLSYNSPF